MMLILNRLFLRQFKGIKALDLRFDGGDATIFGANATGKTTIYDAFLWLLFGKDSQDSSNFNVKPLDGSGNKLPGTEPEVLAEITVDGKPYILRKILKEVWSKPTGQAQPVYARDEVQAWVNDVPMKIDKEYLPFINSLIPEALFKIALHHSHFMRLPWTERRQHLIQISNPDVDSELLSDPVFSGIPAILDGVKNTDDARKRLMEQRKRMNQELDEIPARVDELQKTATPRSYEELNEAFARKQEFETEVGEIDKTLASGEETSKKLSGLYGKKGGLEKQLRDRQNILEQEAGTEVRKVRQELAVKESTFFSAEQRVKRLKEEIPRINDTIASEEALAGRYRKEWTDAEASQFSPSGLPNTCAACGQPLPADQIKAARQKAFDHFEVNKQCILDGITAQGKTAASRAKGARQELDDRTKEMEEVEQEIQRLIPEMDKLRTFINSPVPAINFSDDSECKRLQDDINKVQSEIDAFGTNGDNTGLLGRKRELQQAISIQDRILATQDQAKAAKERIDELMDRKATLGQQIATIDGQLDILAQFVSARCSRLEEHINAMFPTIRWKLFNELKNGGIEDCCTATVNGVPYADLNNAARINAGIEASRVISQAHGITCPCFVDNAESVNDLDAPAGQLIALVVSKDPELRIESAA
jgi:DNA repair exonuclease SbcCD ATPase subunit